ncbi:uncharacterized protein EI90DRAFT_3052192 [Cantharellus anzutake]|uniref:uncharacterized protein n=1 Tax=Cantharellus anzutake TaxID=1750568 RepID=UPI0019067927|nr:uncharacterized protein EI90DRAFT_3052192 [Cantharellus anzutake]KAF8333491.1 hypothetical protein EI90DRAFT_3052192 [Cantharellus anzutake]
MSAFSRTTTTTFRTVLQPSRRNATSTLACTSSTLALHRNTFSPRGMASSASHHQTNSSDTPWMIGAGVGSVIGLYFLYGRRKSKDHGTHTAHHDDKHAKENHEELAIASSPPSPANDVAEPPLTTKEGTASDIPEATKPASPSEDAPTDNAEVTSVKAAINADAPKSAKAREDEGDADYVKVKAEDAREERAGSQKET